MNDFDTESRFIGAPHHRPLHSIDGVPTNVLKHLVKALAVLGDYNVGLNTVEHYIERRESELRLELEMLGQARETAQRLINR